MLGSRPAENEWRQRLPTAGKTTFASDAIRLSRYRVTLKALGVLDLPAYLGSTVRGAFGHAPYDSEEGLQVWE